MRLNAESGVFGGVALCPFTSLKGRRMRQFSESKPQTFFLTNRSPDAAAAPIDRRDKDDLDTAVTEERTRQVDHWRQSPLDELSKLPELKSEVVNVNGQRVVFRTFRHTHGDRLLIVVRTERPLFFGAAMHVGDDGFWALPDGKVDEISGSEIKRHFW